MLYYSSRSQYFKPKKFSSINKSYVQTRIWRNKGKRSSHRCYHLLSNPESWRGKKGTIIKHDFSILNVGDKPLIIYDIIPDCTCTECNLSKKLILPDDKAIISAVIDTKGKYGNFLVNIIVRDNSKEGAHRFIITGHV